MSTNIVILFGKWNTKFRVNTNFWNYHGKIIVERFLQELYLLLRHVSLIHNLNSVFKK